MTQLPRFDVYVGDGADHGDRMADAAEQPVLLRESGKYLASEELADAVNIAIAVGQPLLVTGEGSGTGRASRSALAFTAILTRPVPNRRMSRTRSARSAEGCSSAERANADRRTRRTCRRAASSARHVGQLSR